MESRLLNKLAERGCNVADMLNDTFMGMEAFYEKMLRQFPESTAVSRIRSTYEAGDAKGCFEAAHELKGLSATLGLAPLNSVCSKIVEIVRPGVSVEGVGDLLPELERLNAEFIAIISE